MRQPRALSSATVRLIGEPDRFAGVGDQRLSGDQVVELLAHRGQSIQCLRIFFDAGHAFLSETLRRRLHLVRVVKDSLDLKALVDVENGAFDGEFKIQRLGLAGLEDAVKDQTDFLGVLVEGDADNRAGVSLRCRRQRRCRSA